jgi:acyl-CoA reductase-like NAD-dependent aldehyde dehydrogenase
LTARESIRTREPRLYRELLHAMESARSRLAVAIAAENKRTTRERWRYYLATADRMRKCVKDIRQLHGPGMARHIVWHHALDLLKQPLSPTEDERSGEAQRICKRLHDVLELVENHTQVTSDG